MALAFSFVRLVGVPNLSVARAPQSIKYLRRQIEMRRTVGGQPWAGNRPSSVV